MRVYIRKPFLLHPPIRPIPAITSWGYFLIYLAVFVQRSMIRLFTALCDLVASVGGLITVLLQLWNSWDSQPQSLCPSFKSVFSSTQSCAWTQWVTGKKEQVNKNLWSLFCYFLLFLKTSFLLKHSYSPSLLEFYNALLKLMNYAILKY